MTLRIVSNIITPSNVIINVPDSNILYLCMYCKVWLISSCAYHFGGKEIAPIGQCICILNSE